MASDVFHRFQEKIKEPIHVRVHDIIIKGNKRTKDWVIESLLQKMKQATTLQEIMTEAHKANMEIQKMGVFEKCVIKFDAGPVELPGTTNVIVEVVESERPFSCNIGMFSKPETRNWSLEGALRWKNLLGYGETWDGTGTYGFDATSENSIGVSFPRFKNLPAGIFSRVSLFTQDFHKYSSYKERLLGLTMGIISGRNHEFSYNLTWRNLADPSHRASESVRNQMGHALLSSIKYSYKLDNRNSIFRPTQGGAFATSFQVAGLGPDSRLLRFIRHEMDVRAAIPLGYLNSALNLGASAGYIIPWGSNFMNRSTPLSDRFFMGGHGSLVTDLRGPSSLQGFRTRGIGPTDSRRLLKNEGEEDREIGRDRLGGDFAVSLFADLSFDLPFMGFLREHGIHGHAFYCSGNVVGLSDAKNMTPQSFLSGFRSSVGAGLVIPTRLFRLEINYCRVLTHQQYDKLKNGIQLSFSSSS